MSDETELTSYGVSNTMTQTRVPGTERAMRIQVALWLSKRSSKQTFSTIYRHHKKRAHLSSKFVRSMTTERPSLRDCCVSASTLRRSPSSSWLHRRNCGKCRSSACANVDCGRSHQCTRTERGGGERGGEQCICGPKHAHPIRQPNNQDQAKAGQSIEWPMTTVDRQSGEEVTQSAYSGTNPKTSF